MRGHITPDIEIWCQRALAADGPTDFAMVLVFAFFVSGFLVLNVAWRIIQTSLQVEVLLPN